MIIKNVCHLISPNLISLVAKIIKRNNEFKLVVDWSLIKNTNRQVIVKTNNEVKLVVDWSLIKNTNQQAFANAEKQLKNAVGQPQWSL